MPESASPGGGGLVRGSAWSGGGVSGPGVGGWCAWSGGRDGVSGLGWGGLPQCLVGYHPPPTREQNDKQV